MKKTIFANTLFLLGVAVTIAARAEYLFEGKYYDSNNNVMSKEKVSHHQQLVARSCDAEWKLREEAYFKNHGKGDTEFRTLLDEHMNKEILQYYDRALPEKTRFKDGRYLGGLSALVAKERESLAKRVDKSKVQPMSSSQEDVRMGEYILCKALAAEHLANQFKSGSTARAEGKNDR